MRGSLRGSRSATNAIPSTAASVSRAIRHRLNNARGPFAIAPSLLPNGSMDGSAARARSQNSAARTRSPGAISRTVTAFLARSRRRFTDRLRDELRDVLRLHGLAAAGLVDPVLDHRQTERTAGRDGALLSDGPRRFLDTILVDALTERFLEPHPASAGAAAEGLVAAALHLLHLQPDGDERLPGGFADAVVAREVAGVVVRDRRVELDVARLEPPVGDELRDHFAVVQHLEVPAELRVLVRERVEAVRALRDDLLHAVAVERLDVLLGEGLEQIFVPQPARRIA